MKKVWAWLKKWGAVILGVLLVIVGGGWLWQRHKRRVGRLKDELAVAEATKEIERLRGQREQLAERVGEKDEQIDQIDDEIKRNKRKIVEAHEQGEGLSDDEIEQEFAQLGY